MLTGYPRSNTNLMVSQASTLVQQPMRTVSSPLSQSKMLPPLKSSACALTGKRKNSPSPCTATTTNKRKRVRWEEDSTTRDVKRRVMDLPHLPSSQLSKCERSDLWLSKEDYEFTLTSAIQDVVAAKSPGVPSPDGTLTPATVGSYYTEAMAQTYSLCCSPDVTSTIALENAAILSLIDSSFRGLENHTLPREMRVDRKIRKAKTVSRVLELQGELRISGNPEEDSTECLRLVSEYFSEPSRKFARALGEIDGTFAHLMIEFSNSSS